MHLTDQIGELPLSNQPERNLEKELFGKKGVHAVIDNFERELGILPVKAPKVEVVYHNQVFHAGNEDDQAQLNTLFNDPKRFEIVMWKDTWTVHGDFRVFVIYREFKPKTEENEQQ